MRNTTENTQSEPLAMASDSLLRFARCAVGTLMISACLPAMAVPPEHLFGSPDVNTVTVPTDGSIATVNQVPEAVRKAQQMVASVTAQQAGGAKVVTLPFHAQETFAIPIRPGMFTTISFPKDEPVQQIAVSTPAAVQLQVNATANIAMLKLVQPMVVTATAVTSKHIYYLRIEPAQGEWYQGVSWAFDNEQFGASSMGGGLYVAPSAAANTPAASTDTGASDLGGLYNGAPNFNYRIAGDAAFKPTAVWDNGRFTWVQFANNIQELPALFADGPNGLEIVNYTVHNHGSQILVNRLMDKFVLKLGKVETTVTAQGAR
ncbi:MULTISPECIES: TrbG/VirB9 family P-type conjugative transfer protein [Ralstonia]|jgi:type IV secretory pathway VirB9-like protein|nr:MULTISPECIES: TrbG/VirB9 family P-type conjugative transfer protein [Ralstonia]NOZ17982.1 TrbG/VirB9 family P-type conjugative transfer protein [Betaproteobacteria bacterium]MBA9871437.1 hypothetical protein [Ralstonia insidiosa]MBA9915691.1 hypothetical protein [Ralstonia insidiosa]MBA9954682.1 hypothetical protein [Ralstonia insidiosa]MBA9971194.1 hypothetical protein [Ralstonia insidiosa]